jgi:hypothetical protein
MSSRERPEPPFILFEATSLPHVCPIPANNTWVPFDMDLTNLGSAHWDVISSAFGFMYDTEIGSYAMGAIDLVVEATISTPSFEIRSLVNGVVIPDRIRHLDFPVPGSELAVPFIFGMTVPTGGPLVYTSEIRNPGGPASDLLVTHLEGWINGRWL